LVLSLLSFRLLRSLNPFARPGFAELSKPGPDGEAARGGWANARDAVTMFEYVEACRNSRVARLMKAGVYDETDEKVSEVFTAGDCKEAVNKFLAARPERSGERGGRGGGDEYVWGWRGKAIH
jgi:hypothetical protein